MLLLKTKSLLQDEITSPDDFWEKVYSACLKLDETSLKKLQSKVPQNLNILSTPDFKECVQKVTNMQREFNKQKEIKIKLSIDGVLDEPVHPLKLLVPELRNFLILYRKEKGVERVWQKWKRQVDRFTQKHN